MTFKKIAAFLAVIPLLLATSCSVPEEVKQEANARLAAYSQPFENKVAELYGAEAELTEIKCPTNMTIGSPVPEVIHNASKTLTGKIVINNNTYDAEYYPESDIVKDTVHTEIICEEFTNALPIDSSKILTAKYTNASYEYPKFRAEIDSFEEAAMHDGSLTINIITSENLKEIAEYDFNSIPEIQQMIHGTLWCEVKIIELENTDMLSALQAKIQELHFSYQDTHPTVYADSEYKDAFDYYHIKSSLQLTVLKKDNTPYVKAVYNE